MNRVFANTCFPENISPWIEFRDFDHFMEQFGEGFNYIGESERESRIDPRMRGSNTSDTLNSFETKEAKEDGVTATTLPDGSDRDLVRSDRTDSSNENAEYNTESDNESDILRNSYELLHSESEHESSESSDRE